MLTFLLSVSIGGFKILPGLGLLLKAAMRPEDPVAAALRRLGHETRSGLLLRDPAGSGEAVRVDHVVRIAGGLVVISSRTWPGRLASAAAAAPEWVLARSRSDTTVPNPLRQNTAAVRAVAAATGCDAVGLVVIAGATAASEALPKGAVLVKDLERTLRSIAPRDAEIMVDRAWAKLGEAELKGTERWRRRESDPQKAFDWSFSARLLYAVAGVLWLAAGILVGFG